MDYGADKYGKEFIDDVKALGNVTYMFLPFPIFWALFDQQVNEIILTYLLLKNKKKYQSSDYTQ